jgi:hypothetical protein
MIDKEKGTAKISLAEYEELMIVQEKLKKMEESHTIVHTIRYSCNGMWHVDLYVGENVDEALKAYSKTIEEDIQTRQIRYENEVKTYQQIIKELRGSSLFARIFKWKKETK